MSVEQFVGAQPSGSKNKKRLDLNQILAILGIIAAIAGPFLPLIFQDDQQKLQPESGSPANLLLISNPLSSAFWEGEHVLEHVLYAVNLSFALVFIIVWFAGGYLQHDLKYFNRAWTLWWIGLALFYVCRLVFTGGTLQPRLDIILNNANTACLLLAYVGLAYPKNSSYREQPEVFQRFAALVVAVFIAIAVVASLAPAGESLFIAKLLSGCYAGLAFCFLAARFESLMPQQFAIISVVFLYSFVQVLWSFEGVQGVLHPAIVFALAFLGKVAIGFLVLMNYTQMAERAFKYFDVKEQDEAAAKSAPVVPIRRAAG